MELREIIRLLIETDVCAKDLIEEASVHLPRRGSRWVAAYRDETGRRAWRSTGLRDRESALAAANKLESEAKQKRAAQAAQPRKLNIGDHPGALLTQREVGLILGLSERTVREVEKHALAKLRRALRTFWREWTKGEIEERASRVGWALTRAEVAAVYALTRTPEERQALRKLIALMQDGSQ